MGCMTRAKLEVNTAKLKKLVLLAEVSTASRVSTVSRSRVFWGADEKIFDGGPEDSQTPPVPQDKDEREPMFIQPYDPDYVLEPIYPEYIPLEDKHVFPDEEQPLPPVVSPTAESPEYVIESNPEEDPEEYEDDETEDGPVDYPMDGGDDGDDDDGDSSGDDADDEDEEEEEHLAPADSTVIVPTVEPVSPPEGTKLVIPPPSTDISTTGVRITIRLQASISLPPEAEGPPALSSPPPVSLPLLPSSGCPTQIQTLMMAFTQALIDAVTVALLSPPLPPLPPSLYLPPPVDRMNDLLVSEQPPRKRLCLSTLGSRYEVGESSTIRPTGGRGIDYGFVSTVDTEARRQGISEVGYGIRDTWVDPAEAVPKIAHMTVGEDAQDGDNMYCGGGGLCFPKGLGSLDRIESGDPSGVSDPPLSCVCTRDPYPGTSGIATAAEYSHSDTSPDI
ncbi:hypothetical protein Tco_0942141 [Tanacetum coccineum]